MAKPNPICLSIILCDMVIEDKRTNNKSYINTFNQIWVPRMPYHHPHMCVVISLTECMGRHELAIEFSRDTPEGEERLLELKGELNSPDPLAVVDLNFELRGFRIVGWGKYTIKAKALPDGTILGQRHFTAIKPPQKMPPSQTPGRPLA